MEIEVAEDLYLARLKKLCMVQNRLGIVPLSEISKFWRIADEIKPGLVGMMYNSLAPIGSSLKNLMDEGSLVVIGEMTLGETPKGNVEIINASGSINFVNVEQLGEFRLVPDLFLSNIDETINSLQD